MPHTNNDTLDKKISPSRDERVLHKVDVHTLLEQCLTCMSNKFKLKLISESKSEKFIEDEEKSVDFPEQSNDKNTKIFNTVEKIIDVFTNFWNLNTQDPGCSLVVLHYIRSRTEEDVLGIKMRTRMRMERREDEGVSGYQLGRQGEDVGDACKGDKSDRSGADTDIKTVREKETERETERKGERVGEGEGTYIGCVGVVDSLLRASKMIPFSLHPRQLLIIAWLLESTHAEHSLNSSYEFNHEEHSQNSEIQSAEYSRTIAAVTARGSSVLTLFQAVHSTDRNTVNKGNKIMSNIMHWLDIRVDKIMSIEYGDQITAELLDIKSSKLSSLILQVCGF